MQYDFTDIPSILSLGFKIQKLPSFLSKSANELVKEFIPKLNNYSEARDYFAGDDTSNLATHLRFGLVSPKQVFNVIKKYLIQ